MRPAARQNVEMLCRRIADRTLTDSDCVSFFVTLREEFPARWPPTPDAPRGTPSQLRDLANALAHERRDRGFISDYLRDFADRWRLESQKDSDRSIDVEPVYPIDDLYRELFGKLEELAIDHDAPSMRAAEYHLANRIGWALDRRQVMLSKDDPGNFCFFVGDVHEDSRIAQPGCVFNALWVEYEDWGDEDQPTLFGVPSGHHAHFTVPLFKDFVSSLRPWPPR